MSTSIFDRVRLTVNKMKKEPREEVRLVMLHNLCRYLLSKVPLAPIRYSTECEREGEWEYIYTVINSVRFWDMYSVNYLLTFYMNTLEFSKTLTPEQKHFVIKEGSNG